MTWDTFDLNPRRGNRERTDQPCLSTRNSTSIVAVLVLAFPPLLTQLRPRTVLLAPHPRPFTNPHTTSPRPAANRSISLYPYRSAFITPSGHDHTV